MAKLLPGCSFEPTDEELIQYYLRPKVTGCKPLPSPCFVKECDLYGNMDPEQIWEQFKDSASGKKRVDLYFFTTLKEKKKETNCITTLEKKKKNYFKRTNEKGGTWSNEDNVVVYTTDTKQPIGKMRRFSYSNPSNPQQNGCWVLREYSLDINGSVLLPPPSSTLVLCKLRMKGKSQNISNSCKRKSLAPSQPQPQLQHSHTDAVVHSNCNLKQPLCQAPNSEHEQGGEPSIDDIFKAVEDAGRGEQGETENVYETPDVEAFTKLLNELPSAYPDLFAAHPSTLPGSSQN